jgi:hypothetical protein
MTNGYSQGVNLSRVHNGVVVTNCELAQFFGMPLDAKAIKFRTCQVREALKLGPTQISVELGLKRNAWGQYEDPEDKRVITLNAASRLRDVYKISLDWLYFGDRLASLPEQVANYIRRSA